MKTQEICEHHGWSIWSCQGTGSGPRKSDEWSWLDAAEPEALPWEELMHPHTMSLRQAKPCDFVVGFCRSAIFPTDAPPSRYASAWYIEARDEAQARGIATTIKLLRAAGDQI